jgi:glycosyltransferase involved in cell wall biosynthesis
MMGRSVAVVGDVTVPSTWSGTPFHFWQAAKAAGFASLPWRLDLAAFRWRRLAWNGRRVMAGCATGGYQYSRDFLDCAERQIPAALFATEVITFNPHFPRAKSMQKAGGVLNHYIDAPFAALASGRGLDLRLPASVVREARELERANFVGSKRIVTMARWAAEVAVAECGVSPGKVFTILPGANLDLPLDWNFPVPAGRAGRERDFVLGFVGKEWQRKGLPSIVAVRDELVRRGWKASVHVAGHAPSGMKKCEGIHFAGFIDKWKDGAKFLDFLSACDVGCLFSKEEALGISTLEFLRAGVPVAGFLHEGPADTLPPDSGFRFARKTKISEMADLFEAYLEDETMQAGLRRNARRWSPWLTWERCLNEFEELWTTGTVKNPVRPWLGLSESLPAERVER